MATDAPAKGRRRRDEDAVDRGLAEEYASLLRGLGAPQGFGQDADETAARLRDDRQAIGRARARARGTSVR